MKKINNIIPVTDLQNSREYAGAYNSRDFYKGTSFKMAGEWAPGTHYFNDEYIIDFVSFEGALLSCTRSHIASSANIPELVWEEDKIVNIKPNKFWSFVMSGTEGPSGKVWVPTVSEDGILSWSQEKNPPAIISPFKIKGEKGDKGDVGEQGQKGDKGDIGNNGKIYIPNKALIDKKMIFTLVPDATDPTITVDLSSLKGDDGKTPTFRLYDDILYYSYNDFLDKESIGKIKGEKGDKGDKGDKGQKGDKGDKGIKGDKGDIQEVYLQINFDNSIGQYILSYRTNTSEWVKLGPVGGMPGKSPKMIRVLGDPNSELESELNDRILWGYDGVPVSEWTVLCYLDELKGDQNIEIGCPYNLNKYYEEYDEFGGPIDHNKIWYDPCDKSVDSFSSSDFLYQSYLNIGGDLNKEDFERAFANLSNVSGFRIQFATSFEDLPEPTKEQLGNLWLIPSPQVEVNDLFEEYVVIRDPNSIEDKYQWERWGGGQITVDLSWIKGSAIKIGVPITGAIQLNEDDTIATALQKLSDSIKALDGSITTLTSPDDSIIISGEGSSKEITINTSKLSAKLVSVDSALKVNEDNEIDLYWE